MGWLLRFCCSFLGGMLAASALVLVYVYLLGAPDLPRLPVIGLPHTYVAVALIIVCALVQLYLSLLGLIVDGFLATLGWRQPPGPLMAIGHGMITTALFLLGAWYWRPMALSLAIVLGYPLAVHGAVRIVAGRVPARR
jgi:hypothetical protein